MVTRRVTNPDKSQSSSRTRRPAATSEDREHEMVNLAIDLVERQLREGTASSQVISHYLKLGSSRERLEQERLLRENDLLRSKSEALASAKRVEEMYGEALEAMRSYSGQPMRMDIDIED